MQVRPFLVLLLWALVATGAAAHPADSAIDPDHDGVTVYENDNCPDSWNAPQKDTDGDDEGDVCDFDDDGDQVDDSTDVCPLISNPDQADRDLDGEGDQCDADDDGDSIVDSKDNCPDAANTEQEDSDRDGKGDACDEAPAPGGGPAITGGGGLARVAVARTQGIGQIVAGGLAVAVQCTQACAIASRLVADAATARRLRLGSRRTLARATWTLGGAARSWIFLEPSATVASKLRRAGRGAATVEVTVTDAGGAKRRLVRRVTFR